jgi:hypothetical protein
MSVVGPTVNGRRLEAIGRAAFSAAPGAIPPDLVRQIHDPLLLASIHTSAALGFGVVFLKTTRPDLAGALAALAVAAAMGLMSTRLGSGGGRTDVVSDSTSNESQAA